MFKGLGNMASLIGAASQLPEKIKALNQQMESESITGKSECGRVTVTMNGVGVMQSIQIDPELSGAELEAAVKDGCNRTGLAVKERFATVAGQMAEEMNLPIPGMQDMIKGLAGGGT